MTTRYYSTREACAALGVSRATLYNWDAEPDLNVPGALGWKAATIRRLAKDHDRTVDESVLT